MTSLSPQAYAYLRHPVLSSGETMLQYAIQHLVFTGTIRYERRRMQAHARDPHLVNRWTLTRKAANTPLTNAELFALDLFPVGRPISIGQLRLALKKALPDLERFKDEHMLPDLIAAGLMRSRFVRTPLGKERMQEVRTLRKSIERRLDHLLAQDREGLARGLQELGSNMVLLKQATRERLRGAVKELPELSFYLKNALSTTGLGGLDTFSAFDSLSLGDNLDSGGGFDGGGFDGFGGGDFGGGGDGGDW